MKKVTIREPIWKDRTVGIKNHYEDIVVSISYKDKSGKRMWPKSWILPQSVLVAYPVRRFHNNVAVHIIPIADLELLEIYIK